MWARSVSPDNILLNPGKLTTEEFVIIKRHPEIGYHILGDSSPRS